MTALRLPASLTMSDARQALSALQSTMLALPAGEAVLDASGLRTLDTASLAVLLQCQRLRAETGGALRITGAPDQLRQLARLYGVQALLGLDEPSA